MTLRLRQSIQSQIDGLTTIQEHLQKNAPISCDKYDWPEVVEDAIKLYRYQLEDLIDRYQLEY